MVGIRKPSASKSFKARTTGRVNRTVKRATNPLYGKKGAGFVKDPERSVKNAVYHKTSTGGLSSINSSSSHQEPAEEEEKPTSTFDAVVGLISALLGAAGTILQIIIVVAIGLFILSLL